MKIRRLRYLLLILAVLTLVPSAAQAHVRLRKSDPGNGAVITSTPLALQLWFTEPVEMALTKVSLTDANGKVFALAAPTPSDVDPSALQLKLFTALSAGTYKVAWQTVSMDGHLASGTFPFTILGDNEAVDTAFAAAASRAQRDNAAATTRAEAQAKNKDVLDMRSASPAYSVVRTLSFALLLALIGSPAFWFFVLLRTREPEFEAIWYRMERRVAKLGALAALLYIGAAFARVFLQARLVSGNGVPDMGDMLHLLGHTNWGVYLRVQVIAAASSIVALFLIRVYRNIAWVLATAAVVTTVVATSLASHAGAMETGWFFAVLDDALHMLAVGAWLGGLLWLLVVALPTLTADKGSRRTSPVVSAFSTLAVTSVGIVTFTGVVSAKLRLGSWGALVNSTYGQVLILKVLLVFGVAAIGWFNWKKVRPALAAGDGVDMLRKAGRAELGMALLVIIATSVLVALPTPASP